MLCLLCGQKADSLAWEMLRCRMIPQVRVSPGAALAKYKLEKGMRSSTTYPDWRPFAPGVPHGIEGVVGTVLLAVKTVGLDAERIAAKQEGAPLVVEGIEHHLDRIVVSQRIARQHVPPDEIRLFVFTNKGCEEIFARVAQIGDGRLGDRSAVLGITLHEVADA